MNVKESLFGRALNIWLLCALLLLALAVPSMDLQAGDTTGKVRGLIKDGQGNLLEGVTVTIRDTTTTSRVYTVQTNRKGEYSRIGLEPVVHQIEANMEGFRPSNKSVKIRIGIWVEAHMTLFKEGEVGYASEGAKSDEEKAIEEYNKALMVIDEKPEEAIVFLDKAIELDGAIYEPVQTKAQVYYQLEKLDQSLEYFEKAMAMGSTDPSNYFFLAEIYKKKGNAARAEEYTQRYIAEADDLNPDILYNMAVEAVNANEDGEAKEQLVKLLEVKADYADAHYQLGMIYLREGSNDSAKEHFQRYLELDPEGQFAGDAQSFKEYLDSI